MTFMKNVDPRTVGAVLRTARVNARPKITQDMVAQAAGVERQAVGQWEKGLTLPTYENLKAAAAFLKISYAAALEGRLEYVNGHDTKPRNEKAGVAEYRRPPLNIELPKMLARDVPVRGFAKGAKVGEFHLTEEVVDTVPRPATLANTRDAFAVYVFSDSMSPRYEDGDVLYINPHRSPSAGDDVLIELKPREGQEYGDVYIKRLVRRTETDIICKQFNPPGECLFDRADVQNLYRVMPRNELFGI